MADDEQLAILTRGAAAWSKWRLENPDVAIDLEAANLKQMKLEDVNLAAADLKKVNLAFANSKEPICPLPIWKARFFPMRTLKA
jgi:uncharacterized protein YjbI with pentapeptide repeats